MTEELTLQQISEMPKCSYIFIDVRSEIAYNHKILKVLLKYQLRMINFMKFINIETEV